MATPAQIVANRLNAQKSTGPRTPEGKRIVSRNAVKLGLHCRDVVLPDEDQVEFTTFARQMFTDLQPIGPVESELVSMVVATVWRLRRATKIEVGLIAMYRRYEGRDGGVAVAFAHDASQLGCIERLTRYEASLERRLFRLIQELHRHQGSRSRSRQPVTVDISPTVTAPDKDSAELEQEQPPGHDERPSRGLAACAIRALGRVVSLAQ